MAAKKTDDVFQFNEMGIDERILKAISKMGWREPTPIQEQVIPFVLKGKDVLMKARTGAGKTACFVIPAIQKIIEHKRSENAQETTVLVLAPTKELCAQLFSVFVCLSEWCPELVSVINAADYNQLAALSPQLRQKMDVVIATPARALAHVRAGNLTLSGIKMLIVDEADMVLHYGYEKDTEELMKELPVIYQAVIASATLNEDVLSLKRLVLHNPVTLRLDETALTDNPALQQFVIKCEDIDKHAILAALFKLHLIKGKTLIFVNSVDKGYRMKLFLDQFAIRSCVLNSELPLTSRQIILDRFNEGRYETIVASDEKLLDSSTSGSKKARGQRKRDNEFAISRGLDFKLVSNVINFEFPKSLEAYIHRVGRTARADNKGTVLNFVAVQDMSFYKMIEAKMQEDGNNMFVPYRFKLEEIHGFKYRAETALASITKKVIRECRIKDIKEEMLKSDKLKTFFEVNPKEQSILKHDRSLRSNAAKHSSLKHVPEYIIPPTLQRAMQVSGRKRKIPKTEDEEESNQPSIAKQAPKLRRNGPRRLKRATNDPLKTFSFKSK